VPVTIAHPLLMLLFLVAIATGFCLLGFVIGIWARNFEQLQVVPLLVVTPLTFLGGVFYSVAALGEPWRTVTHLNPILYLVSGFRWTFFGSADVPLAASLTVMAGAILIPLTLIAWIFRTGYRLKN
jgi:ABC-2 type transport system permease protein